MGMKSSPSGDVSPAPAGKALLITGCDSGIGFSLALHCIRKLIRLQRERISNINKPSDEEGLLKLNKRKNRKNECYVLSHVIVTCFHERSNGRTILEQLAKEYPILVSVVNLDVTDENCVKRCADAVDNVLKKHSATLWCLVHNAAAPLTFAPLEWLTREQVSIQMDVNVTGVVNLTQHMLPMLRKGSRIVNMVSFCTNMPWPVLGPYTASKVAVKRITDTFRVELKSRGVHVVLFNPGDFPRQTKLCRNVKGEYEKMKVHLQEMERDRGWYVDWKKFDTYQDYFRNVFENCPCVPRWCELPSDNCDLIDKVDFTKDNMLESDGLYKMFDNILGVKIPKRCYVNAPLNAKIIDWFSRHLPVAIGERMILSMLNLPNTV